MVTVLPSRPDWCSACLAELVDRRKGEGPRGIEGLRKNQAELDKLEKTKLEQQLCQAPARWWSRAGPAESSPGPPGKLEESAASMA